MNTVVVDPGRRKALRLLKEITMLLQEVVQQRMLGLGGGRRQLERGHRRGASNALPADAAAETPEGHRRGVEVPKDGTESPQKVDAEDEVETAQVDAGTRDGEVLVAESNRNVPSEPIASEAVTISDGDPQLLPSRRL